MTGLYIALAIIVVIAIYVVSVYNSLVSLRNKVRDNFSQIDIQLKRRFDLIPNLVETVKGYAKHEKDTLESVIAARNMFQNSNNATEELEANDMLSKGISKIFALAESYPELKANANFVSLQNELSETEDKIAYSRSFYNDAVLTYNNKIEMFPSNIIANMFKFNKEEFIKTEEKEKETPQVKF